MTTNEAKYRIGNVVALPDGPTGPIVAVQRGIEYASPVLYVTVRNALRQDVTRWVTV